MPGTVRARLPVRRFCIALLAVAAIGARAQNQPQSSPYIRRNVVGVFAAYSPNSSHILLGDARNRELLNLGVSYNRHLWSGHIVNWQYSGEFAPVALESDPEQSTTYTAVFANPPETISGSIVNPIVAPCRPMSGSLMVQGVISETYNVTCSRRWTVGEALSPVGFQWNFLPARRVQPFFVGHGGYMYSADAIPVPDAGAFNFTFDLGIGAEIFQERHRSIRVEYRYHHISNAFLDTQNPGIDSGLMQVEYTFGLGR